MWVCSTNVNRHKTILHPNRNKQWSQAFLISVSHVFHVHRVVYTYPRVFVPRFTPSPCTCTPGFRTIWCQLHGATCLRKLGHMIKKIISVFNDELSTLFRRKKEFVFWQWHGKSDMPVFRLYLNAFTFVDMWNWHRKNCKHGVHVQRDSSISGDHFRHIWWFIGEWKNVTNILKHLHTQETLWPGKTPYMWWGRNKENMFVQVWIYL